MDAYIKHQRRNRRTGTVVEVLDAEHQDSEYEAVDGYRWIVVCTEHGASLAVTSRREAEEHYAVEPDTWCDGCHAIVREQSKQQVAA